MNLGALFCLLLAHFISDFPLQFKRIIDLRNSPDWKLSLAGNSLHTGMHFIVSMISIAYFRSFDMVLAAVLISVLHGLTDFIKSMAILRKPFLKYSIGIFLADQICHLLTIFLVQYSVSMNPPVSASVRTQTGRLAYFFSSSMAGITYGQRVILSMVLLIAGLWGVGIFIRILFSGMNLKPYRRAINLKLDIVSFKKNDGADDGGFIIGILERIFIIVSIILGMPVVIGFVLATKSIARLKKFDDDRFVEIFIIGSFISFISAVIIGYMIKALKVLPY